MATSNFPLAQNQNAMCKISILVWRRPALEAPSRHV